MSEQLLPELGRVPQFDARSRLYQIRPLVRSLAPRSYTWRVFSHLSQAGPTCVGYSWVQELMARPAVVAMSDNQAHATAQAVYREAQLIDEWPGERYDGTSILAGAKVIKRLGYINEYRWCGAGSGTALEDLAMAVGHKGPAIIGVNWYEGMFEPVKGFIEPRGSVVGGHAILVHGVNRREATFRLHNSWGRSWGLEGGCYLTFENMHRLLAESGEACVPMGRVS